VSLVGVDYPERLRARGLTVHVYDGWESHGGSASHGAVVLHHTASSSSASPKSDADYCHHGSSDAPLYNVLIDRHGEAWVLAREKSNSSGHISSTALNEALRGGAGSESAAQRGLADDCSENAKLFAVAAQNNGLGEVWGDALLNGMAQASAAACEMLGLHAGHVTQHRVLTARKIDCCGDHCPYDLQALVRDAMGRAPLAPEVDEMWVVTKSIAAGEDVTLGLPLERKSAQASIAADRGSSSVWCAQVLKESDAIGMWDNGNQWEAWLNGTQAALSDIHPAAIAVRCQNRTEHDAVLTLTLSGT
jgi:N-acetylmuramoyl-L-alanine amidase